MVEDFDSTSTSYRDLQSFSEAEHLIITYPTSAKAWYTYIAYCLRYGEVIKARKAAQRGLQAISYRNAHEKLNMWKAILNLENNFGTTGSLNDLIKEAVQCNDEREIYVHMVDAYIDTGKHEELEKLEKIMLKKFKHSKDIWMKFSTYYMQSGKLKEGRDIINRCIQSLPEKEYCEIIGKAAYLEYKYGDIERSLSMYEEILTNHPKRKDLKSVYIHILKELGQHDRAEQISNL